jgi:hypothetical protein
VLSAVNCSAVLDEPYDEGLHIAAVFVILVASAAGACFPGAMSLCGKKLDDQIIGCMRLFAAGWQEVKRKKRKKELLCMLTLNRRCDHGHGLCAHATAGL